MKASNANERRPSRDDAVPQQKFDESRRNEERRSEVPTEIKSSWSHTEDPLELRLPARRDPPWLVVGIAAAFAVMFAGYFYSVLK